MTRQRQVFPRETVAHLWAHGAQDSAREPGGNFYFTGGTLFSYGSHFAIAHILRGDEYGELNGRVLWNNSTYSATTAKHQTHARRALTGQQRAGMLHLPKMNSDTVRETVRALEAKKLPPVADSLLRDVQQSIIALSGKRHGSGPFLSALQTARTYAETAQAFYAHARRRYPLPPVPAAADIPADKAGRAAMIKAFSAHLIRAQYADAIKGLASIGQFLSGCAQMFEKEGSRDALYHLENRASAWSRESVECIRLYALMHPGKKCPTVARISKAHGVPAILERMKAAQDELKRAEAQQFLQRFACNFYREVRKARNENRPVHPSRLPGYTSMARDRVALLGIPADSIIGAAVARATRIEEAGYLRKSAERILDSLRSARSYESYGYVKDALRCFAEAVSQAEQMKLREPGRLVAHLMAGDVGAAVGEAMIGAERMRAAVVKSEAQRLADWISGASNIRPAWEAGTYARIRGDVVETTHGAFVPIAHACRLVRVYDRVVRAGGKEWADGAGPMVGHYRVNRIGGDGSLVIGCHTFKPDEALRLRDLLTVCTQCAETLAADVAAESTNG